MFLRRLRFLSGLAVLLFVNATAMADTYFVAPPPVGNDANDCLRPSHPCATFQRAVDLCPKGGTCGIVPAPGVYSTKTNVYYYKAITIAGQWDESGNCVDNSAVTVDDRINDTGERGNIFWVQDHSILTIACLTLKSYASGTSGFSARQFAIGDVNDVKFQEFPAGLAISASETSKINVHSPTIVGDASRFASATDLSQVHIGGVVTIRENINFDVAFVSSLYNSVVSIFPQEVVGGKEIRGASYQCVDAIIKKTIILPGNDKPFTDSSNCSLTGAMMVPMTSVASQIEAVVEGISSLRSDLSAAHAETEEVRRELARSAKVRRRKDNFQYAILAVLAILTVASTTLLWRRKRQR